MQESYKEVERRIQSAIKWLKNDAEKINIVEAARNFDVPEARLRQRWNGVPPKTNRIAPNQTLNDAQDRALCHFLNTLNKLHLLATQAMLVSTANLILKAAYTDKIELLRLVSKD